MNWDNIQNNWPQVRNQLKMHFNKLSDDDLNNIKGNFRDRLTECIQQRHGYTKEVAQQKLDECVNKMKTPERAS